MPDLRLKELPRSIAETMSSFLQNFIRILSAPERAFRSLLSTDEATILFGAVSYSLIAVVIGAALAEFIKLPGRPKVLDAASTIGVVMAWVLGALGIHLLLRIFKVKGSPSKTVAIFLFSLATLHLVWIPLVSMAGSLMSDTKVVLTYQYAVSPGGIWVSNVLGNDPKSETYVKEREPEKENTVLPPLQEQGAYTGLYRVPINQSRWSKPKRAEYPALKPEFEMVALLLALAYYLSNSWYIAQGLSVVHDISKWRLFALAITGPLILLVTAGTIIAIGGSLAFFILFY